MILGFVTPRIGEKLAIAVRLPCTETVKPAKTIQIYLPIATGLELLFWLVPQFYVSAVAVSLQGFFLGPLFPAAVVATTKLLPKHLHVSGIGFAAAFGGSGAAVFPFVTGVIAQARGVQVRCYFESSSGPCSDVSFTGPSTYYFGAPGGDPVVLGFTAENQ